MSRQLSAAILAPLVYFGSMLVAGWFHPGYSHLTQMPSDLGAVGAPHPAIFNAGLLGTGVLLAIAAPGIAHAAMRLGAGRLWGTGLVVSLLVPGVYFVLLGLLPLPDPRHNALLPLLLPLQFGPIVLALGLRHQPAARAFNRALLALEVALLLCLGVALGVGNLVTPANQGLFIRLYAMLAFSWVGLAGGLLKGWIGALCVSAPVSAT